MAIEGKAAKNEGRGLAKDLCLSLVIPVYNEEKSIAPFLEAARPAVAEALAPLGPGASSEWIFVDDGSADNTAAVILDFAKEDNRIKLINLSRNFGKEAAVAAGIDLATGDALIPIDVDLQDPPEIIIPLVRAWQQGAEVVNAKRINRNADTWMKRTIAALFYRIYNRMAEAPIPENVGDFRLLDRRAIRSIRALPERSRFNKGLFNWVGFKIATVEYSRAARKEGESKWGSWRLWNSALDGITASTTAPLRIWTYLGICVALFAFFYALYLIFSILITGVDQPGYASIMVTMLFLGGIQLISLGVMGEYIGRIAVETRGRPIYVIGSKIGFDEDESDARL